MFLSPSAVAAPQSVALQIVGTDTVFHIHSYTISMPVLAHLVCAACPAPALLAVPTGASFEEFTPSNVTVGLGLELPLLLLTLLPLPLSQAMLLVVAVVPAGMLCWVAFVLLAYDVVASC